MEGVAGVITSADVPGEDGFGVFVNDQPVMARDKVRYVGEAVAAVAAEDPLIAKRALSSINVVYEPLPAVFDPDEALRAGAPVLHDYAPDNVTKHIPIRVGDVDKGCAESDLVIEETYSTQQIEHAYLEPEAGLAYVDHGPVLCSAHAGGAARCNAPRRLVREPSISCRAVLSAAAVEHPTSDGDSQSRRFARAACVAKARAG